MGLEARCRARFGTQVSEGRARLEQKHLVFRGDFSLSVPLKEVKLAEARKGELKIEFSKGSIFLELGPDAEK